MSTFDWLLLGHLVGDWLFQNDWMATGKSNNLWTRSGFVHYIIYTTTILLFFVLSVPTAVSAKSMIITTSIVFVSHWLIDGGNLATRWMKHFGQRDQAMVRIVVDQAFHLLILAGLAAFFAGSIGAI